MRCFDTPRRATFERAVPRKDAARLDWKLEGNKFSSSLRARAHAQAANSPMLATLQAQLGASFKSWLARAVAAAAPAAAAAAAATLTKFARR